MFAIRRGKDRGHANHGWLDTYHTFSFADYHNPDFMGFRDLRVINEDIVDAGQGFPTHPHRDMEIITYILEGELAHRDSMGNGRSIKTGEVQHMSAGTGVTHSEFNPSPDHRVHLLQIWIMPDTKRVHPAYGEWLPNGDEKKGFALVASPDGDQGSLIIQQDARLYVSVSEEAKELPISLKKDRFGWVQVAKGEATIGGKSLAQGDGVAFSGDAVSSITVGKNTEILLFDLV